MSWLSTGDVSGDPPSSTTVKKRNFFRSTSSKRESLEKIYLVSELTSRYIIFVLSGLYSCQMYLSAVGPAIIFRRGSRSSA